MANVILIFISVIILMFGGFAFYLVCEERKRNKKLEKEIQEAKEIERQKAEANKIKADARTGDHERDLDFMAHKLQDYSKR